MALHVASGACGSSGGGVATATTPTCRSWPRAAGDGVLKAAGRVTVLGVVMGLGEPAAPGPVTLGVPGGRGRRRGLRRCSGREGEVKDERERRSTIRS